MKDRRKVQKHHDSFKTLATESDRKRDKKVERKLDNQKSVLGMIFDKEGPEADQMN